MADWDWADTEAEPAGAAGDLHDGIAAELAALGFADAVEVGRGGFGAVYRCVQKTLDRTVAVKVMSVEGSEDRARFLREQRTMAALTAHPNILAVLQVGQTPIGYPFLVMPYCGLGSWQQRIADAGVSGIEEALRTGVKIAGALACAHRAGIVHRDVKPGNVLFTDYGEPALADFGIARIVGGFMTAPGIFHGSPAYCAPELLEGAPPTAESDLYGLGATLFTGLTGRTAFERRPGEKLHAQFIRITTQPLPNLRQYGLPADLADLIEQTMARAPEQRPSALEFGQQLRQLQARYGLVIDEMVLQDGDRVGTSRSGPGRSPGVSLKRKPVAQNGMPSRPDTLVGREAELSQLDELLNRSRLVTITGTGGVGKTALATHAAHRHRADYPDGVWVTELGDPSDGSGLEERIVAALGVDSSASRPQIEEAVAFLRQRRALIVLDGCEQRIEDAAKTIEVLLPVCPQLHVVATSREILAVGGEAVLSLLPLAAPDINKHPRPSDLARCDAVALFAHLARAAIPDFELTAHNAAAVARICARLDGLPLAIEHAAALLRTMSIQQVDDGLRDGYELLGVGHRDAAGRQRSVAACIESSFDLCTEDEQRLWARLSVFAGRFELAAAQYVSRGDVSANEFLDALCALVEKSVLIRAEHEGVVCFRLLELLRDYGRNRTTPTERLQLGRRHADWYYQQLTQAVTEEAGPQRDQRMRRLTHEHRNVRKALQFSRTNDPTIAENMTALLRVAGFGDSVLSEI